MDPSSRVLTFVVFELEGLGFHLEKIYYYHTQMIKALAKALTIVSHVPRIETGNIVLLRKQLSLIFSVLFLARQRSLSSLEKSVSNSVS